MHKKTLIGLLMSALLVVVVSGCNTAGNVPAAQAIAPENPPVPVEVAVVGTGNIADVLNYSGDLEPETSLSLVSIVSGAIEEVMVEAGDEVRAGDPILRIEDTTYRAQLKQAEAGLTAAQANLQKMLNGPRQEQIEMARTALEAAKAQMEGVTTLTDDERTIASAQLAQAEAALRLAQSQYDKIKWAGQASMTPQALQLEQATIGYQTAKAAYDMQANPDATTLAQLRAAVRQAELNLQLAENPFTDEDYALARANVSQAEGVVALAQYQVDNVILRAPFDGIIAEVYATVGSVGGPQLPAVKLIAKDLKVKIDVPENQIPDVYAGQPAALQVSAFPGEDFPAVVNSVAPAADTSSHTFSAEIGVSDPQRKLRPGMFAKVAVLIDEKSNVILVPRTAVTTVDGQTVVFVVSADEATVTARPVTTGLVDDGRIEITDGLSVNETIVTAGVSNLSDGAAIEITVRAE